MRRVHGADRRPRGQVVHDPRRAGERRRRSPRSKASPRADGELHPMQAAFKECHGLQCGFCTPGMVMSAIDLVQRHPDADESEIRERARRQHVPLHRLPEHRQGGAAGRRRDGRRGDAMGASDLNSSASAQSVPPQGRLRASSPAAGSTPTTSSCRTRPTATSCARRTRTRASAASTPRRRRRARRARHLHRRGPDRQGQRPAVRLADHRHRRHSR